MIYMNRCEFRKETEDILYQWRNDALKFDIKIRISKIILKETIKITHQLYLYQ